MTKPRPTYTNVQMNLFSGVLTMFVLKNDLFTDRTWGFTKIKIESNIIIYLFFFRLLSSWRYPRLLKLKASFLKKEY